jgi:hypothetical protein
MHKTYERTKHPTRTRAIGLNLNKLQALTLLVTSATVSIGIIYSGIKLFI